MDTTPEPRPLTCPYDSSHGTILSGGPLVFCESDACLAVWDHDGGPLALPDGTLVIAVRDDAGKITGFRPRHETDSTDVAVLPSLLAMLSWLGGSDADGWHVLRVSLSDAPPKRGWPR